MNVFIILFRSVHELLLEDAFHEIWGDLASKLLSVVLELTKLFREVLAYDSQGFLFDLVLFALHFAFSVNNILQITVLHLQVGHCISISPNICFQDSNFISELLFLGVSL